MRSRLGGKARYFSCDISTMAKDFGYTWGTDIYAELDGDRVSFSEKKSASRNKNDECKLIRVAFTEFESSMKCF